MTELEIEKLRQVLKKIDEQINVLTQKTLDNDISYFEKYEIQEKINAISLERKKLVDRINTLNMPIIKCNDSIDLRLSKKHPETYCIYLHNTEIFIGTIVYRGYHHSNTIGDIGYEIERKYQGNNYAYEALKLLSEKLSEDGIEDFWITTRINNIASIKTIEKFGGHRLDSKDETILLYQCRTNNNKKIKR